MAAIRVTGNGVKADDSRCTIMKTRVLVANHQMIRLDRELITPINATVQSRLFNYFKENLNAYDIVLISDYVQA